MSREGLGQYVPRFMDALISRARRFDDELANALQMGDTIPVNNITQQAFHDACDDIMNLTNNAGFSYPNRWRLVKGIFHPEEFDRLWVELSPKTWENSM